MDPAIHTVALRSARDRLIDRLGIGDAYPLTDLNVLADQLKVPFGGTARIPIENAQAGVTYELCDPKGQPLGAAFSADGQDRTLIIETPVVNEDVTYRIRATKKPLGLALSPQAPRFLDETAPVKVGLDSGLLIEITDFTMPNLPAPVPAPLLDPAKRNPQPSDPRIVPFGASVNVRVNKSQEGVQYMLILDGHDLAGVVMTGDLGAIVLPTGPVHEDTVIQVRATKTFLARENRSDETQALDATLFLKVVADPGLTVSVATSPIADYQQDATIAVAGTQPTAKYRAFVHTIADRDFVRGRPTADVMIVAVAGRPNVQVLQPPRSDRWRTPDGYVPTDDAPVPGTRGTATFTLKALMDDTIVLVQATKDHQVDPGNPASGTLPSATRLDQAAVVLVRPDPARTLVLQLPVIDEQQTGDAMQVSGGQPGVFYYFQPLPAGVEFPMAAYFHQRDDQDTAQNKGAGQLALEVDFAIAADPEEPPAHSQASLATVFPRSPLLQITPFATGSSLGARAVKAQTGVEAPIAKAAQIASLDVSARPDAVEEGARSQIQVRSGVRGISYQLMSGQSAIGRAVLGTGAAIALPTDPITADTLFTVVATQVDTAPIAVVLQAQVTVKLKSNT